MKRTVSVAAIAVRRKDTYRMKEEISDRREAQHRAAFVAGDAAADVATKPLDGKLHIDGDLNVFAIYQAEDEKHARTVAGGDAAVFGELDLCRRGGGDGADGHRAAGPQGPGAKNLITTGEMRELDVDAVLELDIKLYREQELELLSDMYSTSREVELSRAQACFDRMLAKNVCKCKVNEKLELAGAGESSRFATARA